MPTERDVHRPQAPRVRKHFRAFALAAQIAGVFQTFLVALTAIAMLAVAQSAQADSSSNSPYQLSLASPDAYRLKSGGSYKLKTAPSSNVAAHARTPTPPAAARPYAKTVAKVAAELDVDPALIYAVMGVESAYDPEAVSAKGAIGLMQLMPDTARRYGLRNPESDSKQPGKNIRAGATYLRDLLEMFDNDINLVLAAYNAGEKAVIRHGNKVPPYAETRQYLPKVLDLYDRIKPAQVSPKPPQVHKVYSPPLPRADAGTPSDAL